jgi:hypothetical protein
MKKIYAIADLHGRLDLLEMALAQIANHAQLPATPLREPPVNRSEQFARLLHLALVALKGVRPVLDALGGQQRGGDGCPFRRKITGCRRAACLPIPITGIVEIALNAV